MATEGGESPAGESPRVPEPAPGLEARTRREAPGEVVITTVVSADDAVGPSGAQTQDPEWHWAGGDDEHIFRPGPAAAPVDGAGPDGPPSGVAALQHRLAALEAIPATVDTLGKAMRHELERCAGVLFGHDRALGALAARLDAAEESGPSTGDPAEILAERARIAEAAVSRVLDSLDRMDQRLVVMETRVEPLEPLPTVVAALRLAVRSSDELIAGETATREQALVTLAGQQATEFQSRDDTLRRLVAQDLDRISAISAAQAKGLTDVAERLAAAENRLAPLDSTPDDIAALSRILRRELDAVVSDNQARDQMLRRALQNEIDQLRTTSEAREVLAQGLAARLDLLETGSAEAALASEAAVGAAGGRLDALEARIVAVDRIGTELEALGATVATELESLRSGDRAHDQVAGELTRRLSALDARLARLDPVPGEVQSLRTAMLQEAERTVTSLRAADERIGQLAWVPGEFQEARKRIMALISGVQGSQDRLRQLEAALASLTERVEAMRARLVSSAPPG